MVKSTKKGHSRANLVLVFIDQFAILLMRYVHVAALNERCEITEPDLMPMLVNLVIVSLSQG